MEWTSGWSGKSYDDGFLPEGVFEQGTKVQMKGSDGNMITNDISGMTYQEAYSQGLVDPAHGAWWHFKGNSWGGGVINDAVLQENSYIGIRQMSLTYQVPAKWCQKVKLTGADISLFGRDLGFVYKTLKDNLHPFSVRSNEAGSAHEWNQIPYTRTLGFSLNLSL